jgi:hypothetical protein
MGCEWRHAAAPEAAPANGQRRQFFGTVLTDGCASTETRVAMSSWRESGENRPSTLADPGRSVPDL